MFSIRKIILTSAAVVTFYNSTAVFAIDTLKEEDFVTVSVHTTTATGETIFEGDSDINYQNNIAAQDKAAQEQTDYNHSWTKYIKDSVISLAQCVGYNVWDMTKFIAAWNINYYFFDVVEEATAQIVYGATTLTAGPAVGTGAYYTTKGSIKLARWILPGFEGALAAFYAPVTKSFVVDPVIKYGPSVAKGTAKGAVYGANALYNGATSLYNYFRK